MRNRRRGSAIVESAFMMPWLAFLFVGVLDFGFYAYAAICTQNAARAVAISSATGSVSVTPCAAALGELNGLPNMVGVGGCWTSPSAVTAAQPVAVSVTTLTNTTTPVCADCALDSSATSAQAWVTYQTLPMIPIPGVLMGQLTLTRSAEIRVIQ